MDAVLFITFTIVLIGIQIFKPEVTEPMSDEVVAEDTTRVAKLNESFYRDEHAFSEIINALGYPKGGV